MIINPSKYNLLEKVIFDLQITIHRVHLVQIFVPIYPLLYPYGALTSCKNLEKNNEQSPRYLKTD